jgi:hypothetical protein
MSQAAAANGTAIYAILLSVTSAYIIVAYMAGKGLSRSQVTLVNTFYLFSASSSALYVLGATRNYLFAFNQAATSIVELEPYSEAAVITWLCTIGLGNAVFVIASLKFMWDVRHPKAE